MAELDNILVYEWQAWKGYLISHLVSDACRLSAGYEDDAAVVDAIDTDRIDAVLFQIDLSDSSRFPRHRKKIRQSLQRKGLIVLNDAIDNITKSHLHRMLAHAGIASAKAGRIGDPEELLFVKSNYNYGGEPERRLLGTAAEGLVPYIGNSRISGFDQYFLARRREVTPDMWTDKSIVIEKYISNDEQSFYRAYRFGHAFIVAKAHSPDLIKKINDDGNDINIMFTVDEILQGTHRLPGNLQSVLSRFIVATGIEYFCLDIVHDMTDYYIVDINLTPFSGEEEDGGCVEFMQWGITDYLSHCLSGTYREVTE